MKISTFIDRPVLSTVISVLLVLGGLLALANLAIERYPDIAPPTVNVMTTYTGASAETVQKSVIIPLEEAINGVENMTYMYSTATSNGGATITVFFKQGSDPNMAAVNVQNAVSRATKSLPSEVIDLGITVRKRQNNFLYQLALYSPNGSYNREFLANYLKINILPQISRIPGVGDVDVRGADYGMRIWLKPDVMAQYRLEPSDISAVLGEQNIESPTGSFGENSDNTFQYNMCYKGRLEKPEEFGNIVIKALPDGEVLRLKDVARIELGSQSYLYSGEMNHCPSSSISVYQTPGSNATEVIDGVEKFVEQARRDLPIDVDFAVLYNANNFLFASIKNVVRTLLEAIVLVMLVVLVFLGNARSTLIPIIATVVSIVGTFLFLYIFGFSINLLTLFALVLSIGVVVDDSIIVVEAVHSKLDAGYTSSMDASVNAMHDVTAALVTSTLVFMAVFIPVSLMGGTSGVFYTQFGITMAVSVGISAINALTLSPALCAILLQSSEEDTDTETRAGGQGGSGGKHGLGRRFIIAFETGFDAVKHKYLGGIVFFLRHRWLSPLLVVLALVMLFYNMKVTKTGLVPQEDMGTVRVEVIAPAGSSLASTKRIMDRFEEGAVAGVEEIANYEKLTGFGMISGQGTSHGSFSIRMKNWDERRGKEHSSEALVARLKEFSKEIKDATIMVNTPAMIPGYGGVSGLDMYIQDRKGGDITDLYRVTTDFIAAMKQRPEVSSISTSFKPDFPQYELEVDAIKCKRSGISPKEVLSVIHGYYGGMLSTKFNRFTKIYQVVVQADPKYRLDKSTLNNVYVRVGEDMAPVSQFVTISKIYAPENLNRFNMFPCIRVTGRAEEGYSSGDMIKAAREVAEESIPNGYGYDFGGLSREEASSGNNTAIIFVICFLIIYLILCALYESYILPLAVLVSVPFGLWGSFILARAIGAENNIYLQTGLVMLIGLLSKTAILITEYAITKRRQGYGLAQAALGACKERFRPIMMTVLTMIFGLLPLLFASGAGANGNHTIGAGVIGGMTLGTLAMLFVVPAMFIVFQGFQERLSGKRRKGGTPGSAVKGSTPSAVAMKGSAVKGAAAKASAAMSVILLLLCTGLCFTGCSIYKDYQRPQIACVDSLYGAAATSGVPGIDTTAVSSLDWRDIFKDSLLVGYVEQALEHNKDIQMAEQQVAAARAALMSAKGDFLPSFGTSPSVGGTYSVERYGGGALAYSIPLTMSWEIDFAGGKYNKVRRSKALLEQSKVHRRKVQSDVVAAVAQCYYNLLRLDAQLKVSRSTARNWRINVQVMKAMMDAGMTNAASISQTQANSCAIEASIYDIEYNITEAENNFAVLLGTTPRAFPRSSLRKAAFESDLSCGVPASLLSNRPDVIWSELNLRKAYYDVGIAKAAFYPKLVINGEIGWEKALTSPAGFLASLAGSLVQPLYNGGKIRRNLQVAQAAQQEALAEFEKVLLQAGAEVNSAVALCRSARSKTEVRENQIQSLENAVTSTKQLMRHAQSTYLEVLTAEQSLLSARLLQIADEYDAALGNIILFQALGGGVTVVMDCSP